MGYLTCITIVGAYPKSRPRFTERTDAEFQEEIAIVEEVSNEASECNNLADDNDPMKAISLRHKGWIIEVECRGSDQEDLYRRRYLDGAYEQIAPKWPEYETVVDDLEGESEEDIATGLMDMVDEYIIEEATESSTGNIPDPENEDTDQVRISLTCDRDFTADFLRQLANAIEEGSVRKTFETPRGCAEIDNLGDPKKAKTFAGFQIASAPLSFNGKNFVIKDKDWNHDSYGRVCGKVKGSYYFNWEQCHDVKGISHAGHDDWRMPTRDECEAIVFAPRAGSTVNGNSGSRYAIVQLTGVTHAGNSTPVGLLLFPDGLTITGKTLGGINNGSCTYGMTGSKLQAYLDQGCVFLPASGYYYDGSWYRAGTGGLYWSSSEYNSSNGYGLYFDSSDVYPSNNLGKSALYFPCRLVRGAQ